MRSSRVLEPARGTVAQVLASARASLKEPLARPFTPAETRQTNGPLDQRPSSAFHNTAEIWTADAASDSHPVTPTCKARRSALSRGRPNKPQDSPVPGGAPSIPRSCPSAVPAWVKEMDELILLLDSEMTQVLRGGSAVGESLGRVRLLLQKLWPNVEGMAGACGDGDERWVMQRNRLFSSLFRVLERRESDLRLFSARCVLRLLSAGRASTVPELQLPKYEAAVCKVLFQLTKASRNDEAFFEAEAVAPMVALLEAQTRQLGLGNRSVPLDAPLHLAGALKNLSSTETAQVRLGTLGTVSVLCEVLRACQREFEDGQEEVVQLLTHVSGALRNLSLSKAHHKQLAACGAPQLLCSLVESHVVHSELMYHATRVLAKLSLHESMRQGINSDSRHVAGLLKLLEAKGSEWSDFDDRSHGSTVAALPQATALLVRVAFTLGNLTASNERNRALIGVQLNGGAAVLRLLGCAHSRYARQLEGQGKLKEGDASRREGEGKQCEGKEGEGKESEGKEGEGKAVVAGTGEEIEELLVKLIRLLANISISSEVGHLLVSAADLSVLPELLHLSLRHDREEVLLNATSAVTNLSFYTCRPSQLFALAQPLCTALLDVLLHPNEEAVAEAARAFGNFSRDSEVRQLMTATRADEALVILLGHSSREVVFAAAGALVNLGADPQCWPALTRSSSPSSPNGCAQLVHHLRRAGMRDLAMASVACKALFNILSPLAAPGSRLGAVAAAEDAYWSIQLLHESLDELLEVTDLEDDHGADFSTSGGALFRLTGSLLQQPRGAEASEYEELEDPLDYGHK